MKANLIARSMFALGAMSMASAASLANDFPTSERVLYVQECMRANPGPQFEMISKCSCALDSLASEISFDEYVTLSTISKAISIGGERGGSVRDVPSYEPLIKRYRELQAKAQKGCFITPAPR
jgi:hypothetical protein